MYYVLIIICLASDPTCEVENAIYADQSAPIFDDEEECHAGALRHLHTMSPDQLKENVHYQIEVICEKANTPI